jgi:hypothetical protein
MAIFFFGNPVLGPLEDRLWVKASERYVTEGGDPINDLKTLDQKTRGILKSWVDQWKAEENVKLKPVWKEFKLTIKEQVATAINLVFRVSQQAWYSVEKGDLPSFPVAIALPLLLLRRETEIALPEVLGQKIQFKDMLPETRQALAKYAVERSFNDELHEARNDYRPFTVVGRYDPFVIADVIERDFYHLGTHEAASRIDMVILTTFNRNASDKDKRKHQGERSAIGAWNQYRPNRSDVRRFTGDGWNVSEADLLAMARQ